MVHQARATGRRPVPQPCYLWPVLWQLFLGGLIVQFDHHPVGVVDENLPEIAAGHLPNIELHALGLKPLLHAGKIAAGESDMVDHAGIRLLLLLRRRDIDEMDHRLAFAVHPGPGKCEVRPVALGQAEDVLVEPNGVGEFSGPDVEVIEYAHAHAMPLPCC